MPGTRPPRIGVSLDSAQQGAYSAWPFYALRCNYCGALAAAGALPIALPHHPSLADPYLELLDGLVLTGGAFDIDPRLYGSREVHPTVTQKPGRTAFEIAITQAALARDLPILAICGGQQLLHVLLGGKLHQHIPDAVAGALEHEQTTPRNQPSHSVTVVPGTLLHRITQVERLYVNSAHHQAAADCPPGVTVNAYANDTIIEGIESPRYRFCLGVQWHPEFHTSAGDRKIFQEFVHAASQR